MLSKYYLFIKYTISAGFFFAFDLTLFTIFNMLLNKPLGDSSILISTIIARAISSFLNYLVNRNKIFKSDNNIIDNKSLIKYYLLVIIQMSISAALVYLLHDILNINATLIKIPIDIILFLINYFVQKNIIFKEL